jgi:hypothetical protein
VIKAKEVYAIDKTANSGAPTHFGFITEDLLKTVTKKMWVSFCYTSAQHSSHSDKYSAAYAQELSTL